MPTAMVTPEGTSQNVVSKIHPFAIDLVGKRSAESVVRSPKRNHRLAGIKIGDDPFLLTYGDILVKPETYAQMIGRWAEGAFAGLVTVTGSEDVTKGGLFFFDAAFSLKHLVEKPSAEQLAELRAEGWLKEGEPAWYNAGIYIFQPALFAHTARLEKSPRGEYELTDALTALLAAGNTLAGLAIEGRWVDVRDPEVLSCLQSSDEQA